MKKVLMLTLAIMMVAGSAMADQIGVYSDLQGMNCVGSVALSVPATVYVIHHSDAGATASEFKVQDDSGLLNIGAVLPGSFIAIGAWNTGVSVAYTACVGAGPILVYTLTYLALSPPGPCLGLSIVPDPAEANGIVKIADCGFLEIPASSGRFFFNPDGSCPCVEPNPTQESTWGKVKSLYR